MEDVSLQGLRRAVRRGDRAAVQEAIAVNVDAAMATSARGGSLLLEAHERELPEIAELFLAARDERGVMALDVHEAASLGRPGVLIRGLTADPLAIEQRGPDGFFPLHRAAYRGHTEAVRMLLEAGADPNQRSENGARMTPLHSVSAGRERFGERPELERTARLLVEAGCDPSLEMAGGHSAADWIGMGDAHPAHSPAIESNPLEART